MAYQPHTLVTLSGALQVDAPDDEIWQIGIRGFNDPPAPGNPIDPGQLDNYLAAILAPVKAWFTDADSLIATTATLGLVKVVNIGPDGKYTSEPSATSFPEISGISPARAPSFCCVALSWTTGSKARAGSHGRVYPPNFGCSFTSGGANIGGLATNLVSSGQKLLAAVTQAAADFSFTPYVISKQGVSRKITGVRVGDVYDVQRRRKDAVRESYSSGPVPAG